ncbi:hypothetical protein EJF36_14070 [Bacillus sp. HMF5848]|uniref:helix-hairpin-helix domain-containing protein n=1 Tax=Bacillus sp. HMF5848 TaxID=2495421 RepID=UPI000F7ADC35|nr:helix-hairpin-helix domain-containing protein [Bacillus sp. HMF5848]RSK27916.1 hypothetical protein EJF36_14070 [Bacillus sp. HMF5848]
MVLIVIGLAFIIYFAFFSKQDAGEYALIQAETMDETQFTSDTLVTEIEKIFVDIKGAVKHPGVYEVTSESRVIDIVRIAEGFTEKADENYVNLAQRVHDEMVIYVPEKGESSDYIQEKSDKVSLNYADVKRLMTLPGVGQVKAEAIVDYRNVNGPFGTLEELLNVNGIGEKTFEQLKDYITLY